MLSNNMNRRQKAMAELSQVFNDGFISRAQYNKYFDKIDKNSPTKVTSPATLDKYIKELKEINQSSSISSILNAGDIYSQSVEKPVKMSMF